MAHSPFAAGQYLNVPALINIAKSHKKTVYQIALRWLIQKGFTIIPRTSNETHLIENQNIFDFDLLDNEMKIIDSLNKNLITCPILPSY
jgi:methylglyoxal/glyoxal reductase